MRTPTQEEIGKAFLWVLANEKLLDQADCATAIAKNPQGQRFMLAALKSIANDRFPIDATLGGIITTAFEAGRRLGNEEMKN